MRESIKSNNSEEICVSITEKGMQFMEEWSKIYAPWSQPMATMMYKNGHTCGSVVTVLHMIKLMQEHDFAFINCPQWAIAHNVNRSRASVNRLFKEMERRGWLIRKGHSWMIDKDSDLYSAATQGWMENELV